MICFDTCVLIWGIQDSGNPSTEDPDVLRTREYIKQLAEKRETILIPTPAIAEYLVRIPATDHHIEIEKFRRFFQIQTLNDQAVSIAADLQSRRGFKTITEKYAKDTGVPNNIARPLVKIDALILGIAIANKATHIVTNDTKHMEALAHGRIKVIEVPSVDVQNELVQAGEGQYIGGWK